MKTAAAGAQTERPGLTGLVLSVRNVADWFRPPYQVPVFSRTE